MEKLQKIATETIESLFRITVKKPKICDETILNVFIAEVVKHILEMILIRFFTYKHI